MLSVFGGTGVVVTVVSVLLLVFNLISPSIANTSSDNFYKITCVMHITVSSDTKVENVL